MNSQQGIVRRYLILWALTRVFLLCLGLSIAQPVWALTITVGLHDGKPFGWHDEEAGYQGITLQHMTQIVRSVYPGADIEVFFGNPERLLHGLLVGEVDLYVGVTEPRLKERTVNLGRLAEMSVELWRVALEEKPKDPFSGLISVHRFYEGFPQLAGKELREVSEHKYVVQMLKAGRFDGVVATATELCFYAREFGFAIGRFDRYPIAPLQVYLWGRKVDFIDSKKEAWRAASEALNKSIRGNLKEHYCQ